VFRSYFGHEVAKNRFLAFGRRLFFRFLHAIRVDRLLIGLNFFSSLVASHFIIQAFIVVTQTFDMVVRRFEELVRNQNDRQTVTLFNLGNITTLFVQKEACDIHRHLSVDGSCAFLHGFFFKNSQNLQCAAFSITNDANAVATRAGDVIAFG